MVRTLLLCRIRHHFCHLLVVAVDAFIVVIFVIVIVVVAMVAVMWAGARAREEQWQQQQQCGALGVRRVPPGMIEMILRTEEEERLLWNAVVECGRRCTSTFRTLFLPLRWLGGAGGRLDGGGGGGDGPPHQKQHHVPYYL